jgi:hypothetical protein
VVERRLAVPRATLERGYSIVTDDQGTVVRSSTSVAAGDQLSIEFGDGTVAATVSDAEASPGPTAASSRSTSTPIEPLGMPGKPLQRSNTTPARPARRAAQIYGGSTPAGHDE